MWPRIVFALFLFVILPIIVFTQFTHVKPPTEVMNPGNIETQDDWCFSSWCGEGWTKRQ